MSPRSPELVKLTKLLKGLPKWAWGIALILVLSLVALSLGNSPKPQPEAPAPPGTDALSSLTLGLSVILKLGVVVILIYMSLYLIHRWQGRIRGKSTNQLAILETTHLSPRQALHLVQAGSKVVLIGATDQTLTMLTEVDIQPHTADIPMTLPDIRPVGDAEPSNFADLLLIKNLPKR